VLTYGDTRARRRVRPRLGLIIGRRSLITSGSRARAVPGHFGHPDGDDTSEWCTVACEARNLPDPTPVYPGWVPEPQWSGRVLVVVPAWNEEDCVSDTVHEIHAAVPSADIVVVDDGSTDRTVQRARLAGADVIQLPYNLGVGGAMRAGFRYGVRHDYDAVVQVDADGQHDPREIPALLRALTQADVVIGARFARPDDTYRVQGPRWWAMRVLAGTLSRVARTRLTDTTSGFRVSSRAAMELFARHYPVEYLGDTVESLVIAVRSGLRVVQVPVQMRPRRGGTPSHNPARALVYLLRANLALGLALVRRWEATPSFVDEKTL
jgi:glycosyltransferase involved in cell wall biosynthesis